MNTPFNSFSIKLLQRRIRNPTYIYLRRSEGITTIFSIKKEQFINSTKLPLNIDLKSLDHTWKQFIMSKTFQSGKKYQLIIKDSWFTITK